MNSSDQQDTTVVEKSQQATRQEDTTPATTRQQEKQKSIPKEAGDPESTNTTQKPQSKEKRSRKKQNRDKNESSQMGASASVSAADTSQRSVATTESESRMKRGQRGQGNKVSKYELKNVFGEAIIVADQIKDTPQEVAPKVRLTPTSFYELLASDTPRSPSEMRIKRNVRAVEKVCEINENFGVLDIALDAKSRRAVDQDAVYAQQRSQDGMFWANVLEGNALLVEYDPQEANALKQVYTLRHGLPKFYQLNAEMVSNERRAMLSKDTPSAFYHLSNLAYARKVLLQGHKIQIQRSVKINGDSAQITWCSQVGAWAISSKNVTLLAKNEKQVAAHYPESSRYFVTHKIAMCWFQILRKNSEHQLKKELANKIFVGDFVGNSELVNLVRYPRETIIFHNVVNKELRGGDLKVYSLAESDALLRSYTLDVVQTKVEEEIYASYDSLCDKLYQICQKVAQQSLASSEEGAVIKLVKIGSDDSQNNEVISIFKVKSLEFQALSQMVQILQDAINSKNQTKIGNQDLLMTNFAKAFKNIKNSLNLTLEMPHPEAFFFDLFSCAYTMLAKSSAKDRKMYEDLLFDDIVKFMALVLKTNEEKHGDKKYVAQIDFESQVLFGGETIFCEEISPIKPTVEQQKPVIMKKSLIELNPTTSQSETLQTSQTDKNQTKKAKKVTIAPEKPVVPAKKKNQNLPKILALAVAPFAMQLSTLNKIKASYNVTEAIKLDKELISQADQKQEKQQKSLILVHSLEGVVEISQQCNLKLFAYKMTQQFKGEPEKNFYLDPDTVYAHKKFKDSLLSAASIRKEAEKCVKLASSQQLLKIGNPVRMNISSEDELLVVLGLKDPTDLQESAKISTKQAILPESPTKEPKREEETKSDTVVQKVEKVDKKQKKPRKEQSSAAPQQAQQQEQQLQQMCTEDFILELHETKTAQKSQNIKKKLILIVLPVGIPGMGKTFYSEHSLIEACKSLGINTKTNVHFIQNDLIRKQCLNKWKQDNPRASINDGVKATAKEGTKMFKDQIKSTLDKVIQDNNSAGQKVSKNPNDIQIVYLDKNYPPMEIKISLQAINEHISAATNSNLLVKRVALVPEIATELKDFPFSLTFFVQCYTRCLERQGHILMPNEDPARLAKILIVFLQQFRSTKFDSKEFLDEYGFDEVLPVRFTFEHKDVQLPANLENALLAAINQKDISQIDSQISLFCHLMDLQKKLFSTRIEKNSLEIQQNSIILSEALAQYQQGLQAVSSKAQVVVQKQKQKQQKKSQRVQESKPVVSQQKTSQQTTTATALPVQKKSSRNFQPIEEKESEEESESQNQEEQLEEESAGSTEEKFIQNQIAMMKKPQQIQQKQVSSKAPTKGKIEAKAVIQAPQIKQKQYSPMINSVEKKLRQHYLGEFEEVGVRQRNVDNFSSESEDYRIPNTLYVQLDVEQETVKNGILEGFKGVPQTTALIKESIKEVEQFLAPEKFDSKNSSKTSYDSAWAFPRDYTVTCLHVGRLEDNFYESSIGEGFRAGVSVVVHCAALLFVPGKCLVALAPSVEGQEVEERCPHLVLLNCEMRAKRQIAAFVRSACTGKGPFTQLYATLLKSKGEGSNKVALEKQMGGGFKAGNVRTAFEGQQSQTTAYMLVLERPLSFSGVTKIGY